MEKRRILAEALELPPIERASLVEEILRSFNIPDRNLIDQLWAEEAEDRINAFNQHKLKAITAKKVFQQIDQLEKKNG